MEEREKEEAVTARAKEKAEKTRAKEGKRPGASRARRKQKYAQSDPLIFDFYLIT